LNTHAVFQNDQAIKSADELENNQAHLGTSVYRYSKQLDGNKIPFQNPDDQLLAQKKQNLPVIRTGHILAYPPRKNHQHEKFQAAGKFPVLNQDEQRAKPAQVVAHDDAGMYENQISEPKVTTKLVHF